jgi:hypothetical protein
MQMDILEWSPQQNVGTRLAQLPLQQFIPLPGSHTHDNEVRRGDGVLETLFLNAANVIVIAEMGV